MLPLRQLYTLLFYIGLPFIFVRLFWRGFKAPNYRKRWAERLGKPPFSIPPGAIWFHTVSVGETNAAAPLIQAVQQALPEKPILITTMTPTGSDRVKALFNDTVYHMYIPYDIPWALKRFLKQTQPSLLCIMETEIWPNVIQYSHEAGVKCMMMNTRLSQKSAQGYQKIAPLIRPILQKFHCLAAQTADDAKRLIAIGAEPQKVTVTGNMKYDLTIPKNTIQDGNVLRSHWGEDTPTWVAASTHPGEDEIVLAAHQLIKQQMPNAVLILVPRHPERFEAMFELASQQFKTIKRTDFKNTSNNEDEAYQNKKPVDVILGNTMGELFTYYAAADVAFVGGSLVPVGGHNLLEPAALSKPIITGPHLFNFTEISQRLTHHDALTVADSPEQLASHVMQCFSDTEMAQQLGQRGEYVLQSNHGAVEQTLEKILTLIKE